MKTILYGIKNCDSVKKAQKWLIQKNIPFLFHDYRQQGLDEKLLQYFFIHFTWQELLNKRSTSYRSLSVEQKESINNENVLLLFIKYPTLIKRPLLIHNNSHKIGFKEAEYQSLFAL
ncbi:Spx/MgsR family RNA polymerase-binding regulatory protein [Psychromonas sp. CD1]|uniref:Spx/MgsR family RNA polymerase-binding regulatory protein n=1 Tax=Psychromonas sp. CD1 TaxID=1979839 RepID=UPI000B9C1CEF|nr:Spx/MgsR family RNA polymerase-binding regulatory protein [Psychromonas sp. CD1]